MGRPRVASCESKYGGGECEGAQSQGLQRGLSEPSTGVQGLGGGGCGGDQTGGQWLVEEGREGLEQEVQGGSGMSR